MNEALVLLVLIWAALLVPSALRSRKSSPHATVGGFERAMDVLRTAPGRRGSSRELLVPSDAGRIVGRELSHDPVGTAADSSPPYADEHVARSSRLQPHREDPMIARRRTRFVRLMAGTGATLLLALLIGGVLWVAFLLTAAAAAGYTVLLRRLKLQRDEARRVVADLHLPQEPAREPVSAAVGDEGWSSSGVRLRRWGD